MPLVMFLDACEHCARVCPEPRVIRKGCKICIYCFCQDCPTRHAYTLACMAAMFAYTEVVCWVSPVATSFCLGPMPKTKAEANLEKYRWSQLGRVAGVVTLIDLFQGCYKLLVVFCWIWFVSCWYFAFRVHRSSSSESLLILKSEASKVGGSGRQSLTRLSTHMNEPLQHVFGSFGTGCWSVRNTGWYHCKSQCQSLQTSRILWLLSVSYGICVLRLQWCNVAAEECECFQIEVAKGATGLAKWWHWIQSRKNGVGHPKITKAAQMSLWLKNHPFSVVRVRCRLWNDRIPRCHWAQSVKVALFAAALFVSMRSNV